MLVGLDSPQLVRYKYRKPLLLELCEPQLSYRPGASHCRIPWILQGPGESGETSKESRGMNL